MSKVNSVFICQQCGFRSPQFLGKCPECGSWNSLVETIEEVQNSKFKIQNLDKKKTEVIQLVDIKEEQYQRIDTGMEEFNRVLGGPASPDVGQGGGIVPGSLVLVAGDPGIGKSTLLTQLALNLSPRSDKPHEANGAYSLYIAGEESPQQIKIRVDRIQKGTNLAVLNEVDVDLAIRAIKENKPSLVIVDSIQTLQTSDLSSVAGSVGQVKECAYRLQNLAKKLHTPVFLVGHVTKEGTVAGPKTLEHIVDVVLSLEGDPQSAFRILRTTKNRFGSTDEVGVFEMVEGGLLEVKNPSELFLETKVNAPGSVVVVTMNGQRPLLVEIQALVSKSMLPAPRRVGTGVDNNRLQLLVAVLGKRLGLPLFDKDVFVNVTGGLKVLEPAADLGIALAIVSSLKDQVVNPKAVLVGEVGLLGEVRGIRGLEKRTLEAKKLGYNQVISPENAKSLVQAMKLAFN